MGLKSNFELMAIYNQWMNDKLYRAASGIDEVDLSKDCGAFFGSIIGTLNHILVGDTVWLKRFAVHPVNFNSLASVKSLTKPERLNVILFSDLSELSTARRQLDNVIIEFTAELSEATLETNLEYCNMKGEVSTKKLAYLIHHFFNHQTHHRGQLSTLLSQQGIDIGVTDLLDQIPNN